MTTERLFNAIAAHLRPLVTARNGVFSLSETPEQTLSLLAASGAGRWRLVQQWQQARPTENIRSQEREMTMLFIVQTPGQILSINSGEGVSVQRPSGISATTTDNDGPLTTDSSLASMDNSALMQRCTQVKDWLRAMAFPTAKDVAQQWPVMQLGREYWLTDKSLPMRQIAHECSVKFLLDGLTLTAVTVP